MGEWSKKIGDEGEDIVRHLLKMIGWGDALHGVSVPCIRSQQHGKVKKTHGIDYLFTTKSHLVGRTLDHICISSKFSDAPYPISPEGTFKRFFIDLATAIECFRKSEERQEAGRHFVGIDNARDVGVLFWLTNIAGHSDDVIEKLSHVRQLNDYSYDAIYVVDDKRAAFIYDTMSYLKGTNPSSSIEFLYLNTGRNISILGKESSGIIMPVEYVNSAVLPFVLRLPDGRKKVALSISEHFHVDRLKRLIGLARDLTSDLSTEVVILFPDYNRLHHDNEVSSAKTGFVDKRFTQTVKVANYNSNFREPGI